MPVIRYAPKPDLLHSEAEIVRSVQEFLHISKNPLIVITGPTASGKTAFSIRLAELVQGEVINADSRQFYRGMDIGTAKVTTAESKCILHHLLSFLEPSEEWTIAEFKDGAETVISDIISRRKVPLLTGGSGLFLDAVCKNLQIPRVPPQKEFRRSLEKKSSSELHAELQRIDPVSAAKIEPENRVRVIRTLEIHTFTGLVPSELKQQKTCVWDVFKIAIYLDPDVLKERIAARTETIWQSGFLDEVRELLAAGYDEQTPALIAHGYREAIQFLRGELSEEEAKSLMERNTRRYAKRQRTWWRKDPTIHWVSLEN